MVSVYAISSPTGKISPQPWLTAPETRTVVEALTAEYEKAKRGDAESDDSSGSIDHQSADSI